MASVFGVIQMLWLASIGIGAALAPVLIAWLGVETALIATGALLPVLVGLLGAKIARIDAAAPAPDANELRVLASVPIFAPLPGGSLEHLASRLVPMRLEPGTMIVREGDSGDRFYIVAEGEVEVSQDGAVLSELGSGGYFGEIALMRDIPRTATVIARTAVVLYALDREDFLAAVTGHPQAAEAAETVMSARLAGLGVDQLPHYGVVPYPRRTLDEADAAARLENGPLHPVERADSLLPRCGEELAERDPVPRQVPVDRLAVLDDDDRLPVDHRPQERNLEAPVGDDHGEHGDRAAREHEAGHREVVLGHALLDEIADHDEQDQVERLERGELPPPDDPRHEEDEEEREGCAEDDVHPYGQTIASRSRESSRRSPS